MNHLGVILVLLLSLVGGMNLPCVAGASDDAWNAMNAKGLEAYRQKKFQKAIELFRDALSSIDRKEQPDSRQAMTLNNLASAHDELGQYEEAALHYRQSLTIVEHLQGANHPDLIPGLKNLAILHRERRQFAEAERLYGRSLSIIERVLGEGHPHLIPGLIDLANVSQAQGEYGRAEEFYIRALKIGEAELPPAHHHVQYIRMQYATLLRHLNRATEADALEEQAREELVSPQQHEVTK